jgi:hypothetical protein
MGTTTATLTSCPPLGRYFDLLSSHDRGGVNFQKLNNVEQFSGCAKKGRRRAPLLGAVPEIAFSFF